MPRRFLVAVIPYFLVLSCSKLALAAEPANELGDRFQPDTVVATVGDMVILYGDVAALVDQELAPVIAKATNKDQLTEVKTIREKRIRVLTPQLAEKKLQYLEYRRMLVLRVKENLPEAEREIKQNVKNAFDKGLAEAREKMEKATTRKEISELMGTDVVLPRLALLMKQKNLQTTAQLDEALREFGSSLEKQETLFREHHLGYWAIFEKLKELKQQEVSDAEMLDYYQNHADTRRIPFEEARTEIKKSITKDRIEAKVKEIFADLRKATPIWTIYDEEENAVRQAAKEK